MPDDGTAGDVPSWASGAAWLRTGRDALVTLLHHGAAAHDWRRIWFPTYFCGQTMASAAAAGFEVVAYRFLPGSDGGLTGGGLPGGGLDPDLVLPGDVVLAANVFGHWSLTVTEADSVAGTAIITDHTHDPLGRAPFPSDYAIASLRKTLPVPSGAPIWSPRGHDLPNVSPSPEPGPAVRERWAALDLDSAGQHAEAKRLRRQTRSALHAVGPHPAWNVTIERIKALDLVALRSLRRDNFAAFCSSLPSTSPARLVTRRSPDDAPIDDAPFAAVVAAPDGVTRDDWRRRLATIGVASDVLWPYDHFVPAVVGAAERELVEQVLVLDCSARQSPSGMRQAAQRLIGRTGWSTDGSTGLG